MRLLQTAGLLDEQAVRGAGDERELPFGRLRYSAIACSSGTSSSSPTMTSVRAVDLGAGHGGVSAGSVDVHACASLLDDDGIVVRARPARPRRRSRAEKLGRLGRRDRGLRGSPAVRRWNDAGDECQLGRSRSGRRSATRRADDRAVTGPEDVCRPAHYGFQKCDRVLRHRVEGDRTGDIRRVSVPAPLRCVHVEASGQRADVRSERARVDTCAAGMKQDAADRRLRARRTKCALRATRHSPPFHGPFGSWSSCRRRHGLELIEPR